MTRKKKSVVTTNSTANGIVPTQPNPRPKAQSPKPSGSNASCPISVSTSSKSKPTELSTSALIICRNKYVEFKGCDMLANQQCEDANSSCIIGIGDISHLFMDLGYNYHPKYSSHWHIVIMSHYAPAQSIRLSSLISSRSANWSMRQPILLFAQPTEQHPRL